MCKKLAFLVWLVTLLALASGAHAVMWIGAESWLERCRINIWCGGRDINQNRHVDFLDLAILAEDWQKNCESSSW